MSCILKETGDSVTTDPLDAFYNNNERIKELQDQIEKLKEKSSRKSKAADTATIHRIKDLTAQINELILERNRVLKKVRWSDKRKPRVPTDASLIVQRESSPVPPLIQREPTPVPRTPTSPPVVIEREPTPISRVPTPVPAVVESILTLSTLKITEIEIGTNSAKLIMVPTWFKPDDFETVSSNIVYPPDTINHQQFITIVRFRASIGKSYDFNQHLLNVSEESTEMLILSLEAFAQQFGGQ